MHACSGGVGEAVGGTCVAVRATGVADEKTASDDAGSGTGVSQLRKSKAALLFLSIKLGNLLITSRTHTCTLTSE